jgi:hypothetical protein
MIRELVAEGSRSAGKHGVRSNIPILLKNRVSYRCGAREWDLEKDIIR